MSIKCQVPYAKLAGEEKSKWLEALRSGRYKQGSSTLKNINGEYCCLGVLFDVIDGNWDGFVHEKTVKGPDKGPCRVYSYEFSDKCVNLNDVERKSLEEIADWVEKEVWVEENVTCG